MSHTKYPVVLNVHMLKRCGGKNQVVSCLSITGKHLNVSFICRNVKYQHFMLTTKLNMLVTKKMNILYMDLHLHSEMDHMLTECSLHFHLNYGSMVVS